MMILNLEAIGAAPPGLGLAKGGVAGSAATPLPAGLPGLFAALLAGESGLLGDAALAQIVQENADASAALADLDPEALGNAPPANVSEIIDAIAAMIAANEGDGSANGQAVAQAAKGETPPLFAAIHGKPPGEGVRVLAHALVGNAEAPNAPPPTSEANVTRLPSPHLAAAVAADPEATTGSGEAVPPATNAEGDAPESSVSVQRIPAHANASDVARAVTESKPIAGSPPGHLVSNAAANHDGEVPGRRVANGSANAAQVVVDEVETTSTAAESADVDAVDPAAQKRAYHVRQAIARAANALVNAEAATTDKPAAHLSAIANGITAESNSANAKIPVAHAMIEAFQAAMGDADVSADAGQTGTSQSGTPQGTPATATPHARVEGAAFELKAAETAPKGEPAPTTLDNAAQRTAQSVRMMVQQGTTTMRIKLVPAHLGEIHIVVESGAGGVKVDVASASHVVRESLETHLPMLREQLARDGLDVTRITVGAEAASSQGSGSAPHRQGPAFDLAQRHTPHDQRGHANHNGDPPPQRHPRDYAPSAGSQALNVFA